MSEEQQEQLDEVQAISALGEPSRRTLYDFVAQDGDWVSRDQAADATGLERGTAAHHLDRLADEGLLEVDYRRLTGRAGPGAGRPAKLYRRSDRDFDVSLPPRKYRLAGQLLARAADRSRRDGVDISEALETEASEEGGRWADTITARLRGTASRRASTRRNALVDLLDEQGFEPTVDPDDAVTLRNCPFDYLASEHTDLICGMNLCLLDAAVEGVGRTGLGARLEPGQDHCCVRLRPK